MNRNTEYSEIEIITRKDVSAAIIEAATDFYTRGWLFGTSGNLSAVLQAEPFRVAITGSGLDKGHLREEQIIEVDDRLNVLNGTYNPSSESALHVAIEKRLKCKAVYHTHSVWSSILSQRFLEQGGFTIGGYEMLKGLSGVSSHKHSEWFPVLENSQDMNSLAVKVDNLLQGHPEIHCFLLSGHGLYTWGATLEEARRHVEVIEFLLDVYAHSGEHFQMS